MSDVDERDDPKGAPELDLDTHSERWGWSKARADRWHHRLDFGAHDGDDEHDEHELPDTIRKLLQPVEYHSACFHQHPAALAWPSAVLAGALAGAAALNAYAWTQHAASTLLVRVIWFGFLAAAAWYAWRAFQWHRTWLVITPRRLVRVSGWPAKSVVSLPWRRCRDLEMMQPWAGALLGYCTLIAPSVGTGHALGTVEYVPDPERVYRMIWGILEPARGGSPTPEEVE